MIKENLEDLEKKITQAAEKSGRQAADIKLLVVTKTHSVETIKEALAAGARYIGENKIQEAEAKIPHLAGIYEEFHFIGHLQSNKIKKLIPLRPELIHSIDKISTARKLNNYLASKNLRQNILIQVNCSGESSKFGIEPAELKNFLPELSKFENLQIQGLMTIGLTSDNEQKVRAGFKLLKQLYDSVPVAAYPNVEMKYLSMGMTHDFILAIEEGANLVRIGSAIFGARDYSKAQK
ncbi:MAG: YggS family pyridoxal phosphate-dependent enzyme [Candidatus Cloacimonadales bacterium]